MFKHTAQRSKDTCVFDLSEIHVIKRDEKAKKIFGLHSGGSWLVLSEDLNVWDKLSEDWDAARTPPNPFPGAMR